MRRRKVRRAVWEFLICPGCRRTVAFLPEQSENTCGWCGTVVTRGLV